MFPENKIKPRFFSQSLNVALLNRRAEQRTAQSRYNKCNRTASSVHQALFGVPCQECLYLMHSQARALNTKITLISFVLFLKILTSLRSVNILRKIMALTPFGHYLKHPWLGTPNNTWYTEEAVRLNIY